MAMAITNFQMTNYSTTHIISLNKGPCKVQDGTLKLIPLVNLNLYEQFITDIKNFVERNLPSHNIFYPDHDDFTAIDDNMKQLNNNNNRQFLINQALTEQVNNLTLITNKLTNAIATSSKYNSELVISIQNRLRLVKEEIVNIRYAIQWAKLKIVNSILLEKRKIEIALKTLKKENMPFSSTEEALIFAETSVLYNSTMLAYRVKIPLTETETYVNILVKPVKKNNTVINIMYENIIKNENNILGISSECKSVNLVTICKKEQLVDLNNDTCVTRLLRNEQNPICQYSNAYHIRRIEMIQPGLILLNEFNGTINNSREEIPITGTYTIKFSNLTIKIDKSTFYNKEFSLTEAMPAKAQISPIEKERINLLSLESIHQLYLNIERLGNLKRNTDSHQISINVITILMITLFVISLCCRRRKNITLQTTLPLETLKNEQTGVNAPKTAEFTTYLDPNNLLYF